MANNQKNKTKKPVKNYLGECKYKYESDKVIIDFTNQNGDPAELAVFYNLSQSYLNAALILFDNTKKFMTRQEIGTRNKNVFLYVPAFFCFRHYIEMQLKYFYMRYVKEQFENIHDLKDLLNALKDKNCPIYTYFVEAVDFIQKHEKYDSQFRYLATKQFEFEKQLVIDMKDIEKVRDIAMSLNVGISMFLTNEFIEDLINKKS